MIDAAMCEEASKGMGLQVNGTAAHGMEPYISTFLARLMLRIVTARKAGVTFCFHVQLGGMLTAFAISSSLRGKLAAER